MDRQTSMGGEMVLLRGVDDTLEGWKCMPLEEFLERINLASWKDGQELVGMVLPQARQGEPQGSGRRAGRYARVVS